MMELGAVLSCLLVLLTTFLTTVSSLLLLSYLSSILPVKRNTFTFLDTLFIKIAVFNAFSAVNTTIVDCVSTRQIRKELSIVVLT